MFFKEQLAESRKCKVLSTYLYLTWPNHGVDMKLVMVRHGQSLWNKENLFTGWADIDLTEQGKIEAIEAGKLLADYNFDRIFCSELTRAKETLKGILAGKTTNAHITYDWHLNERHYGALEGLNKKDTAEKYGEEVLISPLLP